MEGVKHNHACGTVASRRQCHSFVAQYAGTSLSPNVQTHNYASILGGGRAARVASQFRRTRTGMETIKAGWTDAWKAAGQLCTGLRRCSTS